MFDSITLGTPDTLTAADRRDLEEPIAAGIAVPREIPVVVTEGNYLLLDRQPWPDARAALDAVWFMALDDGVRRERLIARHVAFGKSPDAARAWVDRSDERNADLIRPTAAAADLVFTLADDLHAPGSRGAP